MITSYFQTIDMFSISQYGQTNLQFIIVSTTLTGIICHERQFVWLVLSIVTLKKFFLFILIYTIQKARVHVSHKSCKIIMFVKYQCGPVTGTLYTLYYLILRQVYTLRIILVILQIRKLRLRLMELA